MPVPWDLEVIRGVVVGNGHCSGAIVVLAAWVVAVVIAVAVGAAGPASGESDEYKLEQADVGGSVEGLVWSKRQADGSADAEIRSLQERARQERPPSRRTWREPAWLGSLRPHRQTGMQYGVGSDKALGETKPRQSLSVVPNSRAASEGDGKGEPCFFPYPEDGP